MNEPAKTSKAFVDFFSNPLVGIIGSIASILGVFLAIYFYLGSKESRELTYYVHPVKAEIVKAGQASKLSVKMGDKELKSDITAAQIAFWNAGDLAIRAENILKPFRIRTEDGTPILEATIRKTSREVTRISLDNSMLDKGIILTNWQILEKNDGAIIQVIYAGGSNVRLVADGIIEGQPQIKQLEFSGTIQSPEEQYKSLQKAHAFEGIVMLIMGTVVLFAGIIWVIIKRRRGQVSRTRSILIASIFGSIPYIGYGIYTIIISRAIGPPFGF